IAGGFLLRNGSLALQANHAQQAKAKSFTKRGTVETVPLFETEIFCYFVCSRLRFSSASSA
ncbi:hypothetical protein, partial [Stomatobaculum longum]|uniref:hypothetical protein n=1 Tax=Stomatobaculum longum TaxID=796942 RepID=UPI0028053AE1